MTNIPNPSGRQPHRAEMVLRVVTECSEILFDSAPVMMHSADRDFRLVDVNRRWLQTLGYPKVEVLGRQPFEFLTQESRTRHVKDVVPLFLSSGVVRGIAVQLLTQRGRVLDMVLDVDAIPGTGTRFTYATLYDGRDVTHWAEASTTLRALQQLTNIQGKLEGILLATGRDNWDSVRLAEQRSSGQALEIGSLEEVFRDSLQVAQDVSLNLRSLAQIQQDRLHLLANQQQELLLLTDTIGMILSDLSGGMEHLQRPGCPLEPPL